MNNGEKLLREAVRAALIERLSDSIEPDDKELLLKIDNSPYHMLPIDELESDDEIDAVDRLAQMGLVRLMPADARFPERVVLTSGGSHATGTFDWDTLRDERPRHRGGMRLNKPGITPMVKV